MRDNPFTALDSAPPSLWYARAMQDLVGVVQDLSEARDVDSITAIVREAARRLTGCDGATFVLRDGDKCYYADENAIEPLWKGMRFPMEMCISGWVMLNAQPVSIADIYADPRIPAAAYRPTFVKSLAMVPIRRDKPIGAIGNYWASHRTPSAEEMAVLQALADTTSVALENAGLYESLRGQVRTLEAQQTRIAAQHESLEVFARALAHDLKEPVRTVRAFSELIASGEDPPEAQATYFELIRRAADRMGMLVDTVFQYTQLDDPSRVVRRPCDMKQIFTAATDNLAQLIRERHAVVTSGALPVVPAHAAHMMQVMQNLIANAIRHGPPGVDIRVEASETAGAWTFSVRDNGPGVEASDAERIFQPFKRLNLNEEGAGLGLAICRKIMALHNGRVWCEPSPDGGHFLFSMAKAGAAAADETRMIDSESLPDTRQEVRLANVLVVDDREADVELTRVLLQVRDRMQFNLHIAHGGQEALDTLRRIVDGGDRIDLLLLDINMPGMSGFEMLEKLRQDKGIGHVTVVMCSGSTYHDDLARAEELGAAGYMVKPPSLAQLKPMLETIPDLTLHQDGNENRLMRAA